MPGYIIIVISHSLAVFDSPFTGFFSSSQWRSLSEVDDDIACMVATYYWTWETYNCIQLTCILFCCYQSLQTFSYFYGDAESIIHTPQNGKVKGKVCPFSHYYKLLHYDN